MNQKPTRDELLSRIPAHIAYRNDEESCKLIWKGYLAALMEWGLLAPDDYHELNRMLGSNGQDVIREIFLGHPDT
jgi:hypothetical protein